MNNDDVHFLSCQQDEGFNNNVYESCIDTMQCIQPQCFENKQKLIEIQQDYQHLRQEHENLLILYKEQEKNNVHLQNVQLDLQRSNARLQLELLKANKLIADSMNRNILLQKQLGGGTKSTKRKPYEMKEKINYERHLAQREDRIQEKNKLIQELVAQIRLLKQQNIEKPHEEQCTLLKSRQNLCSKCHVIELENADDSRNCQDMCTQDSDGLNQAESDIELKH